MPMNNDNLLLQRHELKYYISWVDYLTTKEILEKLMYKDEYQVQESGYFVRSLYLDDIHDSAVSEKLAGVERRDKYRLRIYDPAQRWVKLERKRKLGNYVRKDSIRLSKQDALEVIAGDIESIYSNPSPAAMQLYQDFKRTYFRPVVIIDYIRDALRLDYNNIRITFDYNLSCNTVRQDLFDPVLPTYSLQHPKIVIMEIKYNNFLPSWFSQILRIESATRSAISKYTLSRMKKSEYFTSGSPWN